MPMRVTEAEMRAIAERLTEKRRKANGEMPQKRGKYGNVKVTAAGETFDSRREHECFLGLQDDLKAGRLISVERQIRYVLQEGFEKAGKRHRAIEYVADFRVVGKDGRVRVIDAKGMETEVFKIKRKLFEKRYADLSIELW